MAQKRMIDKKISVSEQVANLSVAAQCLYTWSVPHADDIGLLQSSSRTLKATITPMWDMKIVDFEALVAEILKQKLWDIFEYDNGLYYRLTNFTRYQTLKRDRQPQTILPIMYSPNPRGTWKLLESIGFQTENFGSQLEPEVKRSEVKRSEEREESPTRHIGFITKVPEPYLSELSEKYKIAPKGIQSKATDLLLWCKANGKVKKDYKAFLENALKRDFRKLREEYPYEKPKVLVVEKEEEISPEMVEKNKKIKEGISNMLNRKKI